MNTTRALRSCLALTLAGYLALSPTLTTLAYAAELSQDESGSTFVVEDEEDAAEETAEDAEAEDAEGADASSEAGATSEAATETLAAECEASAEATASAASSDEATASLSATEQASIDTSDLPDSDELAEGYIESALAGDDALSLLANYGVTYLGSDGDALALYYELVEFVQGIAANGGSTVYTYTVSETCAYDDFSTMFYEIKDEQVEVIGKVLDCLLVDCPYDFYWYDKTTGLSEGFGGSYSGSSTSGAITVTITLSFSPADAYAGSSSYTVVTPATSISTAAATAQAIVDEHAGTASVLAKLTAYKDEICALVSYNSDAASDSYEDGYGDPWQLIYVFDGDDTTNVVCEGYSKAFQYLCDLTWPSNDPVTCYIVTGTLTGGTGEGGHMWNLVAVDGASWLVDVTNSDSGTVGEDGGLFLVGASDDVTGSASEGYTFTALSTTVSFVYYDDTIAFYGEDILTLTSEEFSSTLGLPSLEDAEVALEAASFVYTGSAIEPEVTVTLDGVELELGVDYTVAYADNVEMGTATVTVTGMGDYTGCVELTFTIADECTVNGHSYVGEVTAEATCTEEGAVTYTCSTCGETYTEVVAATGHSWDAGTVTAEATCTEEGAITYTCSTCGETYTEVVAATGHTEAAAVVENEVAATCTTAGSYDSVVSCSTCGEELSRETTAVAATGHSWDAGTVTAEATCTENGAVTYTCSTCGETYAEVVAATGHSWSSGTVTTAATCTSTGVRTYTCSACGATKTASIAALGHSYTNNVCSRCGALKSSSVVGATVTGISSSYTYTGSAIKPTPTVKVNGTTLTLGTDYTVAYSSNTAAGTATVKITGTGSYSGSTSKTFTISTLSLSGATVTLSSTSYTYNGSARKPTPTVKISVNGSTITLTKDTDYTVSYSSNTNAGTATCKITGTGSCTGTVSKTFTIKARSISSATVTLSSSSMSYTGSARKPTVKSLKISGTTYSGLVKGTDYTISYSNNKSVGTATVKITGTGNFTGTVKTTFTIKKASISSSTFTVTLSTTSYTYNGKARKPTVTVTNSSGVKISSSNYTVSYASGRKAIGKYKVTIKGKGNLKGSTSVYFTIKPGKVSISSAKSSTAKKLTVAWKKLSGSVKYQIAYRVKGTTTWKYKTVSASTVSKTISGLTGGKTYQVRVRAYKKVGGTTYYGSWSTTKSVKVKSATSLTSSTVVYVTPSGSKYHSTKSCTGLNSAKSITKTTYGKIKNSYSACSICW